MGPDDPWSAGWRPDKSGERLQVIRSMRRGALVAALVYLPVALLVAVRVDAPQGLAPAAVIIGLPAVALLGAGLTPAALGSGGWAALTTVAFALGAPVAAVTSLVIAGYVADSFIGDSGRFGGPILRLAVGSSLASWPLVSGGAILWTVVVRRLHNGRR